MGQAIILAFRFLTVMPIPYREVTPSPQQLGKAVTFFPLVGVILGGILAGAAYVLSTVFPPPVAAAFVLALWIGITGALHLDGLLDACDGLWGGTSPEERLRIMRDERVGAFAFAGGIVVMLSQYAALLVLLQNSPAVWGPPLLIAPVLGRQAMAWAMVMFPYARPTGLGQEMQAHVSPREVGITTLLTGGLAGGVGNASGFFSVILALGLTWGSGRWLRHRVGGFTGDLYGALCLLVEVITLLTFTARAP